jgi:D-tyrosyl-tRNA(Tyr) deacylase
MRVIVQRVSKATVLIEGAVAGSIENGLMLLVGFTHSDSAKDILWCVNKLVNLRIFPDENGAMSNSILSLEQPGILIVSNFTLYGNTEKGLRPNFMQSAPPAIAEPLYNQFVQEMKKYEQIHIATGQFGTMMEVSLVNDGPVTLVVDSPTVKA